MASSSVTHGRSGAVNAGGGAGSSSSALSYGRVTDIILDKKHPKYKEKGSALAINGVFYSAVKSYADDNPDDQDGGFAYAGNARMKNIPLIGEIVAIESRPAAQNEISSSTARKVWVDIVNIWNTPEHNASPNTRNTNFAKNLFGKGFKENGKVNPLQMFPGDFAIEGRQGQSIRFTGTQHVNNLLVTKENNGQPLILISNGQIETKNGFDTIIEDINKDLGSIYFTGNHQIPLTPANKKRKSYNKIPIEANAYKKPQVLITSGRLFLNAREESILLSAAESVGLNAKTLNFDADEYICLDGKTIFLGEKARTATGYSKQPVLLGKNTVDLLEDLINAVEKFSQFLVSPTGLNPVPATAVAQLKKEGGIMFARIKPLKARLSELKSKKVFTE
ncbi:MAG: hypothetical protein ACO22Y_00225 [Sediminibacterium sp.]